MPRHERSLLHVCHAQEDRDWVEGMLRALGVPADQVRTRANDQLGASVASEIARAVQECAITVVVLSRAARREALVQRGAGLADYARLDESGARQRILINRDLPEAELSLVEKAYVWLDCTDEAKQAESFVRLRRSLADAGISVAPEPGPASARALSPADLGERRYGLERLVARAERPVAALALVALIGMTSGVLRSPSEEAVACESAVQRTSPEAVAICAELYERTGDPSALSWLGAAWLEARSHDQVRDIAAKLATTHPVRSHYLRGMVALRTSPEQAQSILDEAAGVYAKRGETDDRWRLRSLLVMAKAALQVGKLSSASLAAELALELADRLGSRASQIDTRLMLAEVSYRSGDWTAADSELDHAAALATRPCEWVWVHLARGRLETELRDAASAARELAIAAAADRSCGHEEVSGMLALAQVWLARRRAVDAREAWARGETPRAAVMAAEEAVRVELLRQAVADRSDPETLLLRAHVAADVGALAEAAQLLGRAEPLAKGADLRAQIAVARGELAELRGGPFNALAAERHYRRAVSLVRDSFDPERARTVCLVRGRCRSYDGLLGLLARSGRWLEVLELLVVLDGGDRAPRAAGATRILIPVDLEPAPRPPAASSEEVRRRYAHGLVLVIAPAPRRIGGGGERAYRLHVVDGTVTGEEVAGARDVWRWREALRRDTSDRRAAEALSRVAFPAAGTQGELLHVLVSGPLHEVPLGVLRSHRWIDSISTWQRGPAP